MRATPVSDPIPCSRLSIFTQYYPPDFAATGQFIEELATHLGQDGLQVQVFTEQPGYAFQTEVAPAVEHNQMVIVRRSHTSRIWPQRIRGKAINGLLFCLRTALYLITSCGQHDILLLTTAPPYLPVLGYLANRLLGRQYVCLLYDLYPDIAVELRVVPPDHWLPRLWDAINQRIWRRAKGLIVLSPTMRERIIAKCPAVADKVSVIHSWANPDWIVPLPKQDNWFAHQYGLTQRFTVLYSGNMGRCHDMATILTAAAVLRHDPVEFVFVGDGAQRLDCLQRVEQQGLGNCRFLPYQDKQFLPYSLTACDLALISIREGFEGLVAPSKLYGCMAAGRPLAVVCEPESYLRQIMADAQCGSAFCQGDGAGLAQFIRFLLQHPAQAEAMGLAGRHYLQQHFTLSLIGQQYAEVLGWRTPQPTANPSVPQGLQYNMEGTNR